jgi:uncharacterized protein YceK
MIGRFPFMPHAVSWNQDSKTTPPRSGLVQPADRANDEERDRIAVPIERHGRAPCHGSSLSFGRNIKGISRFVATLTLTALFSGCGGISTRTIVHKGATVTRVEIKQEKWGFHLMQPALFRMDMELESKFVNWRGVTQIGA